MASTWTAFIVLAVAFCSAAGVPLKEDPLVTKAKEIVANVNNYLEMNKLDQVDLPDLGKLITDNIQLTNIKMSNLSSMQLIQGPLVEPQNQSQYLSYVEIGLNRFEFQFDFEMNSTDYQQQGHFSISPKDNSFILQATVEFLQGKSCKVHFARVDLYKYGDYEIDLQPDNIPNKDEIIKDILEFSSPSFVPWFMKAIEKLSLIPYFKEDLSYIVCQVLTS